MTIFILVTVLSAAFGLAYFPTLNRLSRGFVSPYAKADIKRRAGAAGIDAGLVIICVVAYWSHGVLFLAVGALYALFRDALFVPGQSIGKFFTGVLVVNLDTGRPCGRLVSAKRNFIFVVPGLNVVAACLEPAVIFRDPQGQRLGDRLANTQVVEGLGARELVRSFQEAMLHVDLRGNADKQPAEVK